MSSKQAMARLLSNHAGSTLGANIKFILFDIRTRKKTTKNDGNAKNAFCIISDI